MQGATEAMDVDVNSELSIKPAENGVRDTAATDAADAHHALQTGDSVMSDDRGALASQDDGVETTVGSCTDAPHEEANESAGKGESDKDEGAATDSPSLALPPASQDEPQQDTKGETFYKYHACVHAHRCQTVGMRWGHSPATRRHSAVHAPPVTCCFDANPVMQILKRKARQRL